MIYWLCKLSSKMMLRRFADKSRCIAQSLWIHSLCCAHDFLGVKVGCYHHIISCLLAWWRLFIALILCGLVIFRLLEVRVCTQLEHLGKGRSAKDCPRIISFSLGWLRYLQLSWLNDQFVLCNNLVLVRSIQSNKLQLMEARWTAIVFGIRSRIRGEWGRILIRATG